MTSEINNEVTFHAENKQKLMIELHKYVNGLSNSVTKNIYILKKKYRI